MSNLIVVTFPASSTTAIAPLQTLAAAGNLALNSALINTGVGSPNISFPNIERTISLTSANNLSAINFTVNGFDYNGVAATQTIAGPNANTVYTTTQFNTVTSISAPAAVAAVSAGTGTAASSPWIVLDGLRGFFQASLQCVVTGTVTYDVDQTLDAPETYAINTSNGATNIINTPTPFNVDASLTAATTNQFFYLTSPVTALKVSTELGSTGSLTFTILQQGVI
jgi:hypothetical protein